MRFKTQRERDNRRLSQPVWCDCCQDAPATYRTWTCLSCTFVRLAPLASALADPDFETCPNCQVGAET